MDLGLKEKVALVTGSSAGIGYAIAEKLALEGCQLIICGRNQKRLEEAEQKLARFSGKILKFVADIQQEPDSKLLVQESLKQLGKIDILINNSEGAKFDNEAVENISKNQWNDAFSGKLMGYIRMTNLVLPTMKQQKWGRIINIVGSSGKEPSARLIKSGVANAGLINFTKAVATQVAPWNILVNTVNPGLIDTPRHQEFINMFAQQENKSVNYLVENINNSIPLGRRGSPDEVANLVVFLASECSSYITGVAISVDGGGSSSAF
ncbi:SDR family oxidoreductase [Crocosphaera sp. XPORK-15E]|uniref:SDR family oxidoreductase n=1 Tax=Crocosphaera sp. XPORK-15E TaxID=3110247 RepID=UPI002B1EEEFF|nr:SDR family oxidoreductase [Crocosphaera sp. XPORK-15E]MEA5536959.1 SDR family oxidoreductase [Crocosphaera sp. XPORK-15E]